LENLSRNPELGECPLNSPSGQIEANLLPEDPQHTDIDIMKPQHYFAVILAAGYFTFTLFPASGAPAGHLSAPRDRGNETLRFIHPFWGLSYFGLEGNYDSEYSYVPTPEQKAYAEQQLKKYLTAVKQHRKRPAARRYISVETLKPTKKQLADYTSRLRQPLPAALPQLRCLMVFDTQTEQFVGAGCYVVASEPTVGEVDKFETASAEFVGQGTL
jgi:hypothetical protein